MAICSLCRFCPAPFGICIFLWFALVLGLVAIGALCYMVIVDAAERRRHRR